ncbi:MAG: DUF4153 domain-containing protein, partial [Gemmatimonadota bacterium]
LDLGLHLLVAFLPFIGVAGENGFWQYNRTLFLRFLVSALYSTVLYIGLSLALAALDQLFGVNVEGETYIRLMFAIAFVFNTWFFLGGVPTNLAALQEREEYPAGLRVFTQFVLIPLVAVYLLILTAYLGRVLATREWPSGWIGWLVSGVAVAGTLALLLVHPLRERKGLGWINAYGRWFYVVLLPSVGMLVAATLQRVGQYGFTERRYFLLVLALYLGGIAIFYGVTGSRRIRWIPLVLALVAFGTLAGPWGAYAVSRRSQLGRVEAALARNGMLVDGMARPASAAVSLEDRGDVSGALEYLIETHGPRSIAPLVGAELAGEPGRLSSREAVDRTVAVMDGLGLEYVSRWRAGGTRDVFFRADVDSLSVDLSDYSWLVEADLVRPWSGVLGVDTVAFRMDSTTLVVTVSRNGTPVLNLDLGAELVRIAGLGVAYASPVASADMTFEVESATAAARVVLQEIEGSRADEGRRLRRAHALILLRFN